MLAEQVLRIISGVLVTIYVARHLGPDQFGVLSYILAISAFAIAIARLGMEAVLVRELVSNPQKKQELMGTAFWLMLISATTSYLLIALVIGATNETNEVKIYALIVTSSTFFISLHSIDYFFQSKLKAKYSTICKVLALAIMSIVKLVLVSLNASLFWFVIASVLDHVLLAIFLLLAMSHTHSLNFVRCFDRGSVAGMLRSAWPMVLSAIGLVILIRIDQIMIRNLLDLHQVGIYSAAIRIYEAWIVLPYILSVSLLPAIVKLRAGNSGNYHQRLTQLFSALMWLSIVAAILTTAVSEPLVLFAFGPGYAEASPVLSIVMWAAVFATMGSLSARYFNVEHMEKKILSRTLIAAALNILLNIIAIPAYGIKGAAATTVLCLLFSNYAMDWLDKDLKKLLKIKNTAFIPFKKYKE